MDPENYFTWNNVENTVSDRLQNNSLAHLFSSKVKISKSTKILNNKFKKFNIKNYDQYVRCKKSILKNLNVNEEVTDDSDLNDDDYEKFYQSIGVPCLNKSEVPKADERFQWVIVKKKGLKEWTDEDVICYEEVVDLPNKSVSFCAKSTGVQLNLIQMFQKQSAAELKNLLSSCDKTKNQSSVSDKDCNLDEKNSDLPLDNDHNYEQYESSIESDTDEEHSSTKKVSPSKCVKKTKSSKKTLTKKSPKDVKRNLSAAIDSVNPKVIPEDDEWNEEFISSDFQAQSTKIFSETFSENNQFTKKSSSLKSSPNHNELNQPKDSGIEEDSKDDNQKFENFVTRRKRSKKIKNDCLTQNQVSNQKDEVNSTHSGKSNTLLEKNKIESNESNRKITQSRQPLKIIGQETLLKKYTIVKKGKLLKPIREEDVVLQPKQNEEILNDNCNKKSKSDINDKLVNSLDVKIPVIKDVQSNDEHFDLNGSRLNSCDSHLSPNNTSEDEFENKNNNLSNLKNTLQRCKSPYLKKQYQELKQLKLIESDVTESELETSKKITNIKKINKNDSSITQKSKKKKSLKLDDFIITNKQQEFYQNKEQSLVNILPENQCLSDSSDINLSNMHEESLVSDTTDSQLSYNQTNYSKLEEKKLNKQKNKLSSSREQSHEIETQNDLTNSISNFKENLVKSECLDNYNNDIINNSEVENEISDKAEKSLKTRKKIDRKVLKKYNLNNEDDMYSQIKTKSNLNNKNTNGIAKVNCTQSIVNDDEESAYKNDLISDIDIEEHKPDVPDDWKNFELSLDPSDKSSNDTDIHNTKFKTFQTTVCINENKINVKESNKLDIDKIKLNNESDNESDRSILETESNNISKYKKINLNKCSSSSEDEDDKQNKKSVKFSLINKKIEKTIDSRNFDKEKLDLLKSNESKSGKNNIFTQKQIITDSSDGEKSDESTLHNDRKFFAKNIFTQKLDDFNDSDVDKSRSQIFENNLLTQAQTNLCNSQLSESKKFEDNDYSELIHSTSIQKQIYSSDSESVKSHVSQNSNKSKTSSQLKNTLNNHSLINENSEKINCLKQVDEKLKNSETCGIDLKDSNVDTNKSKLHKINVIKKTQENKNKQSQNIESQDMFSSLENLSEGIDKEKLIQNITSNADIRVQSDVGSDSKAEANVPKRLTKISELVERDNLIENIYVPTMTLKDISDDEEIFILDIPKYVFDKNLNKKKFSFSKTTLQLGNDKYEAFQKKSQPTLSCVFESSKDKTNALKTLNIRPVASIVARRKKLLDLDDANNKVKVEDEILSKPSKNGLSSDKKSNNLPITKKSITVNNGKPIKSKFSLENFVRRDPKSKKKETSVYPQKNSEIQEKTNQNIPNQILTVTDDAIKNKNLVNQTTNLESENNKKQSSVNLHEDSEVREITKQNKRKQILIESFDDTIKDEELNEINSNKFENKKTEIPVSSRKDTEVREKKEHNKQEKILIESFDDSIKDEIIGDKINSNESENNEAEIEMSSYEDTEIQKKVKHKKRKNILIESYENSLKDEKQDDKINSNSLKNNKTEIPVSLHEDTEVQEKKHNKRKKNLVESLNDTIKSDKSDNKSNSDLEFCKKVKKEAKNKVGPEKSVINLDTNVDENEVKHVADKEKVQEKPKRNKKNSSDTNHNKKLKRQANDLMNVEFQPDIKKARENDVVTKVKSKTKLKSPLHSSVNPITECQDKEVSVDDFAHHTEIDVSYKTFSTTKFHVSPNKKKVENDSADEFCSKVNKIKKKKKIKIETEKASQQNDEFKKPKKPKKVVNKDITPADEIRNLINKNIPLDESKPIPSTSTNNNSKYQSPDTPTSEYKKHVRCNLSNSDDDDDDKDDDDDYYQRLIIDMYQSKSSSKDYERPRAFFNKGQDTDSDDDVKKEEKKQKKKKKRKSVYFPE